MRINMADWKQITARIRRARTGKDPAGQLSNLFQKTRDAMVAFELAKFLESSGQGGEAAKWYATAAQRFRRQDWKSKAQEAATRLGGGAVEGIATESATVEEVAAEDAVSTEAVNLPLPVPEPGQPFEQTATGFQSTVAAGAESAPGVTLAGDDGARTSQHRGRGRRGGRNRRGGRESGRRTAPRATHVVPAAQAPQPVDEAAEPRFSRVSESSSPQSTEVASEGVGTSPRARYGDPGLSSRLTLLEMQFRRLLNCPPMKLNDGDRAPAGPGVFLLSDSELTTHYYVEDCQTLRVAISGLARGSGARRGSGESIKPRLAEHLGIAESRVTKYLAEHCVVRYLQLDQDASHFAHFVIAVLRPTLNE
jgi:hypothetical protein